MTTPPAPPDPPRRRGRPRKAVAGFSAIAPPKRKRVTFNLKPKILHQKEFLSLASAFILRLQPPASLLGGVMWKTTPVRVKQVPQDLTE